MQTVYVDNKKKVTTNIASVEDGVAFVDFFVDNQLALTRPVPIPEQANGNTADPSFTNIIDAYVRRLAFGAHIGLKQDETVKSVT
jgi:hypothetical protein